MLSWKGARIGLVLAVAWSAADWLVAQSRPDARDDRPAGRRIEARDGDVILLENDAQVSVIRRKHATLRIIANPADRSVIVLADHAFGLRPSDGIVDESWRFDLNGGTWPIEARWEGRGLIEEILSTTRPMPFAMGLVLELPQGRIRLAPSAGGPVDAAGYLAVLTYTSAGNGDGQMRPFDAAEQHATTTAVTGATISARPAEAMRPSGDAAGTATGGSVAPAKPAAPVRPGGDIPTPRKIRHVDPVMPDAARAARVLGGTVILELVIDADGAVEQARVLRSVALLDEAAVAAARQWIYEPTLVNGQAVSIIITATVEFKMQ